MDLIKGRAVGKLIEGKNWSAATIPAIILTAFACFSGPTIKSASRIDIRSLVQQSSTLSIFERQLHSDRSRI